MTVASLFFIFVVELNRCEFLFCAEGIFRKSVNVNRAIDFNNANMLICLHLEQDNCNIFLIVLPFFKNSM